MICNQYIGWRDAVWSLLSGDLVFGSVPVVGYIAARLTVDTLSHSKIKRCNESQRGIYIQEVAQGCRLHVYRYRGLPLDVQFSSGESPVKEILTSKQMYTVKFESTRRCT